MNVLILEDNEKSRLSLEKIVQSCRVETKVYVYGTRGEAYLCAMNNRIDLFLIDIILEPSNKNDNSGINFADEIREHAEYKLTPIIFITTLQGLEVQLLQRIHCYDYIEKPIGDGQMVRDRIEEALNALSDSNRVAERETIVLHYDGLGYVFYVDELVYFSSQKGKLSLCTRNDIIEIPHVTAKSIRQKIKYSKFLEPTYGTFVNIDYIEHVDFRNKEVFLNNTDIVLPIGGRKAKEFREGYLKCPR
ncbi:MAG: response regulator [Lachnospiraceae bacterium]|nr:response regulator [Lachnospiraceae bacterium]